MPKVYKVVDANNLEHQTQEGWCLEGEPLYEETLVGTNANAYAYNPRRPEEGIAPTGRKVKKLMFLLCKDQDTVDFENSLRKQLQESDWKCQEAQQQAADLMDKLKSEKQMLADKLTTVTDSANLISKGRAFAAEQVVKMEKDIAKIRAALGDIRMKEILG